MLRLLLGQLHTATMSDANRLLLLLVLLLLLLLLPGITIIIDRGRVVINMEGTGGSEVRGAQALLLALVGSGVVDHSNSEVCCAGMLPVRVCVCVHVCVRVCAGVRLCV